MIVNQGASSVSMDITFLDDNGFPLTGKVAADFPACKWSGGSNTASTAITLSDLALITTAHPNDNVAGGIKEREGGKYRLDLPNNMFTATGIKTLTFAESTNKRIIAESIDCVLDTATLLLAQIVAVKNILEGDVYIDTTVNPWMYVIILQGSGDLSTGTRLLEQEMFQVDDTPVNASTKIPAQYITP